MYVLGIDQTDYYRAKKRLITLEFTCNVCMRAEADDTDVAETSVDLSLAEAVGSALHSTLAEVGIDYKCWFCYVSLRLLIYIEFI